MTERLKIGFDAKRIVRNGTGLGSYGRTLVNDLASYPLELRLYAPDEGRDQLRQQIRQQENVRFCYPAPSHLPFSKALWRSKGIVSDLKSDGIQVFHGLSGELPIGIRKSGIKSVVTIHDLIFLRHPEFYHWIDTKIYAWKFRSPKTASHSSTRAAPRSLPFPRAQSRANVISSAWAPSRPGRTSCWQ